MTRDEAIRIANSYVAQRTVNSVREGVRYEHTLAGAHLDAEGTWSVLYQITIPDSPGAVVDGPSIVVVDPESGKALFFHELF